MPERQHRVHRGEKTHGRRERERLSGDVVRVVAPGRVRPRVGRRNGIFRGQGPWRIRHPGAAATLAIVHKGIIHANGRRGRDHAAEGEQLCHVHHDNLIVVLRLGRHRHIQICGGVLAGDGANEDAVLPWLAGRHGAINPIRAEIADVGCRPIQCHGVGRGGGGTSAQCIRRAADVNIVHIPAILHHRRIRYDMKTRLER